MLANTPMKLARAYVLKEVVDLCSSPGIQGCSAIESPPSDHARSLWAELRNPTENYGMTKKWLEKRIIRT